MIFYLTLWFPPAYRGRFIAIFCSAIPIAGIISGPLSGLLLGMDGIAGLHGWQWLFLIQGLPAVLLAFVVFASPAGQSFPGAVAERGGEEAPSPRA